MLPTPRAAAVFPQYVEVCFIAVALYAALWSSHERDVVPAEGLSGNGCISGDCLAAVAEYAIREGFAGYFLAVFVDGAILGAGVAVATWGAATAWVCRYVDRACWALSRHFGATKQLLVCTSVWQLLLWLAGLIKWHCGLRHASEAYRLSWLDGFPKRS